MDRNHAPTWCPGDRGPATCPAGQAPARGPDDQGFLPRLASLLVGWPWASHLAFPSCSFLMGSGGCFRPYLFYREAPGESYKCSLLTLGHEAGARPPEAGRLAWEIPALAKLRRAWQAAGSGLGQKRSTEQRGCRPLPTSLPGPGHLPVLPASKQSKGWS